MSEPEKLPAPPPYVHKEPEPLAAGVYICRDHGRLYEVHAHAPTHAAICGACSRPLVLVTDPGELEMLRPIARRGEHLKRGRPAGDADK